jgi:hypothetical protein
MRRMSWRSSIGISGRPGLAFQRQNKRQPARCQRITVSGRTTTSEERYSHNLERKAGLQSGRGVDTPGLHTPLLVQRDLPA